MYTGWNDNIFYGRPNGGKPKENLGLDIAINRKYGQATHGAMSKVMTITEKYTWCAKMELLGYLSGRIQFYDYEEGYHWIKDYGMMEEFVNPY